MVKIDGGTGEGFFQMPKTIYGGKGSRTPYMTRAWIGRLRLHIFHRGDEDPDPHDHPWDFWTFPLVSYIERVYDPRTDTQELQRVQSFRVHFRKAEHRHRVIGAIGGRKIITIVWRRGATRSWGFWVPSLTKFGPPRIFRAGLDYIYNGRYGGEFNRVDVV